MSISNILFPNISKDIKSDYLSAIPSRNGQVITRFAPSPTGFLHIGGVYTSLISRFFAHQNGGKFILRIEDTDQNRKIERGVQQILEELAGFGIQRDEGPKLNPDDTVDYVGNYGPYIQSQRLESYKIVAAQMLDAGIAYPCFLTSEELDEIRKIQTVSKQPTGVYGHFAKDRNLSEEQISEYIFEGKSFVIRLKSPARPGDRTNFHDLVKGFIEIDDNFEDVILLKSDGFPTYHFAHIVDDYMMGTSHVIRTDEWLPSVPKHIQIYNSLLNNEIINRPIWQYAHPSPVMKNDNGSRRKLSKRKDPEAKASFFTDVGYPIDALKQYLLTIIDTKYNDAKSQDINAVYGKMDFANFSTAGAIMDMQKLDHFSAEYMYNMPTELLISNFISYISNFDLSKYDPDELPNDDISEYISAIKLLKNKIHDSEFIKYIYSILSFDRDKKIHKNYLDIVIYILPFFDEYFDNMNREGIEKILSDSSISDDIRKQIKSEYISYINNIFDINGDIKVTKDQWFEDLKILAAKFHIAISNAQYKEGGYVAKIGDLAMLLRVWLYGQSNTPDLYNMINVLGKDRIIKRLGK